ncbi:NUDIX domain-containing protein [Kribbella sp. NBC_00889]|uniref:NUDIX domain-containing protein n=1 Tax=Kribbella sp. NBC_00889 TaxID=2975974 RepID=UPI00386E79B5|nr:NUDIX domain-containing protein [Kribbella sp. NBC_00889]
MGSRSSRLMTSVFLVRGSLVLLLYRKGSRAMDEDSWVGIGGHLEPGEINDPTAGALRELEEEIGVRPDQISDLALRYVALRDTGTELRQTYYFTAVLRPEAPLPVDCAEGDLHWFDLTVDPSDPKMPPTARIAFAHWLSHGRHDEALRFVTIGADGSCEVNG